MQVSEMRTRLATALQRGDQSYSSTDLDYYLQMAFHDLDIKARVDRAIGTVTMLVDNPQVDLSTIAGFDPNRIVRCEIAYTDQGTWSGASVAYVVGDLVKGDGDPDSYFYAATTAHTSSASNEPGTEGGRSVWELRNWKRGNVIELKTYETVARLLGDSDNRVLDPLNPYVRDANVQRGKPTSVGVLNRQYAFLYPVPTSAWKMDVIQDEPVTEWIAGVEDPDIDLPLSVLLAVIDPGAASKAEPSTGDGQRRAEMWRELKDAIRGRLIVAEGVGVKDELAFRDHTDYPYVRRL